MISLRHAEPADAPALVALVALLGHSTTVAGLASRLVNAGLPTLVAIKDEDVVGLCGLHQMSALHREQPVGRISILVVTRAARGMGIGRMLVAEAEAQLRAAGCGTIEVTSNERLVDAHRFYRQLGFDVTSKRLAKAL